MPADLVSKEAIPELAARIDSPALYRVLRYLRENGFILNGQDVDDRMAALLQRLVELGLVDPGYEGPTTGPPYLWIRNGNGSRVLRQIETSPSSQSTLESKFTINSRARTALRSLPERDQLRALLAVDALAAEEPISWPKEELVHLGDNQLLYLLQVSSELRAFIRILNSGDIELLDLVQEDTLRQFLEQHHAEGKAG